MIDLISADVLEWAANYTGPKFHALLCDPPYHLHDGNPNAKGGFMGKAFDGGDIAFDPATWAALAEHLHPGGFVMAFASSRGWHRLAVALEDAGLRIHPSIFGWAFGSGFPKATRIDTQIDKAAGAKREGTGESRRRNVKPYDDLNGWNANNTTGDFEYTAPATPLAAAWEGHRYGRQALKPALEPIIVAQKPYAGRPVDSITATGAGALWVDGGRVPTGASDAATMERCNTPGSGRLRGRDPVQTARGQNGSDSAARPLDCAAGRWPPNFCLSHLPPTPCPCAAYTPDGAPVAGCRECGGTGTRPGCERVGTRRVKSAGLGRNNPNGPYTSDRTWNTTSTPGIDTRTPADADGFELVADWRCVEPCPVRRLGEQSGELASGARNGAWGDTSHNGYGSIQLGGACEASSGNAARFFPNHDYSLDVAERIAAADPVAYVAKASRRERNAGCEGLEERIDREYRTRNINTTRNDSGRSPDRVTRNPHPTVKPLALARWLATLLLPPDAYAPRRILIPFAGSGSECIGAMLAGWEEIVGVEREAEYVAIAEARLAWWAANRDKAPEVRAGGGEDWIAVGVRGSNRDRGAYGNFASDDGRHARTNGHAAPAPMLPGMEAAT